MNYFEMVKEFAVAFRQPVGESFGMLTDERHDLRIRLIREEWKETVLAQVKGDKIEELDGFCDMLYVTMGHGLELGYPLDCDDMIERAYIRHIPQSASDINYGHLLGNSLLVKSKIDTMATQILQLGWGGFASFNQAFAEVHRSNMAKLWSLEEFVEVASGTDSRHIGWIFAESKSKPDYYVATRPDGKIMKPPSWTPPNLAQFINQ